LNLLLLLKIFMLHDAHLRRKKQNQYRNGRNLNYYTTTGRNCQPSEWKKTENHRKT